MVSTEDITDGTSPLGSTLSKQLVVGLYMYKKKHINMVSTEDITDDTSPLGSTLSKQLVVGLYMYKKHINMVSVQRI